MTDYKPKERQELEELYRKQNVRINELEQENKKLKEENEKIKKEEIRAKESWRDLYRKECDKYEKLKEKIEKTNELLSNVTRCSEQYRGKMINIMEELKMFLYKE